MLRISTIIFFFLLLACNNSFETEEKKIDPDNYSGNIYSPNLPNPLAKGPYRASSNKYYKWRFSQNEEYFRGLYIYPLNKSTKSDLVIIVHGNFSGSDTYKEYTSLQKHLASYGYRTVSIKWKSANYSSESKENEVGDLIKKNLKFLYEHYSLSSNKLTNDVVLIGHSRGAMAVIQHAGKVKEFGKKLRSVIAAAPSPQSYHANRKYRLYKKTDGLLILYGSNDEDVVGSGSQGNIKSGFKLYDEAGYESTALHHYYPNKDMVYIKGARHNLFKNYNPNIYGYKEQYETALAYTLSHIELYSGKKSSYNSYLKFQKPIASLHPSVTVFQQHSDSYKRVIANFENNNKAINYMGGNISYHSDVKAYVNNIWSSETGSPHRTKILRLYWNKKSSNPYVRFYIPGNYRKWSNYKYLSFRIQQRRNTYYNFSKENQDFSVRLKDSDGKYQDVRVSNYADIHYPFKHTGVSRLGDLSLIDGGMISVIIPLSAFNKLNLNSIARAGFRFNISGHKKGSILVDNIELYK